MNGFLYSACGSLFFIVFAAQFIETLTLKDSTKEEMIERLMTYGSFFIISGSIIMIIDSTL